MKLTCACVSCDSRQCLEIRYSGEDIEESERCECSCHRQMGRDNP